MTKEDVFNFRGLVINQTIYIERLMDIYVSEYFTEDIVKQHELQELILGDRRMTYGSKYEVFHYLINTYKNDFIKTNFPNLLRDMKEISELRNEIAHLVLDTSPIGLEFLDKNVIVLIRFRNEGVRIYYNEEKVDYIKLVLERTVNTMHLII
jgi:hypothetical protein